MQFAGKPAPETAPEVRAHAAEFERIAGDEAIVGAVSIQFHADGDYTHILSGHLNTADTYLALHEVADEVRFGDDDE